MNNSKIKIKSLAKLFFGVLSVSTGAILIRFALIEAAPLVIAAYRLSFSAVISLIVLVVMKPKSSIKLTRSMLSSMVLSGILLAIHFASWISSLELTSVSSSVVVVSTTPLWVALLSPLVLKEKVKGGFYFGLLVACIGGVIVASNERCILSESGFSCGVAFGIHQNNSYLGLLLALFGAFAAAGYMLIGRKLSSQIDTLRYTAIVYSVAAITMLFVVILRGEQLFYFTSRVWVLFIAIAIIPQILGHTVLNYSLQSLPATTVSVALLGEPIGSTIFAVIFLQEVPSMLQLIGGFVIMLGIAYSVLISRR